MASKWPADEMDRGRQSLATHTQNGCQTGMRRGGVRMRRLLFPTLTLGSCPGAHCPLTGLSGGLARGWLSGWPVLAVPTRCTLLQVRSGWTKLNLQLCSYVAHVCMSAHTPDLGTLSKPQNQAFWSRPELTRRLSQTFFPLFIYLHLRQRARHRATRLLRDDSAKACGFLPSPWRTLKCPCRQKSSSGTVSPPTIPPSPPARDGDRMTHQARDADG